MTQPFTSDTRLPNALISGTQGKLADSNAEAAQSASCEQPAIVHPNFDPKQTPLDPARPLSDIPEPARRVNGQLHRFYGKSAHFRAPKTHPFSHKFQRAEKWFFLKNIFSPQEKVTRNYFTETTRVPGVADPEMVSHKK